jgi:aprataxin
VDLDDFPLAKDDKRRARSYLKDEMKCWQCGKNYENRFKSLKENLATEFEEWKRE